ncbi:exonuclease SbcCD subunit D [Natronosporangium hydrolyticum]|uniref:Nuclease SbcCD subunit D n=1 Tax=Natronosporangium hydrolyticum TaxID=2811111 RepID=A0A895YF25_9ACTN|nr:exonuclease SbcCD subunit D [Natronosporangium hydrolyticum]QSB16464.1 exonuclease SbcCD subunit D [Natronosporangium hydrolyticum]
MKILHTSDWHVGKVLKGASRADEHAAVLAELVEITRAEAPDLVIVAGDLFDTAAPTPAATRLVTGALTALRGTGAEVVAIAGNHDNGAALDALRPWADAAGIVLRGTVRRAEDHLITGETSGGERWRLVALPFLSQRYAVRATEMFELSAAEATQTYADHLSRLLAALTAGFASDDHVNLITTHLTVVGATTGGGEREAHTILAYAVPATIFPASAHYVALGHLHRAQTVPGPAPVRYSGSPLAVDFGEGGELSQQLAAGSGGAGEPSSSVTIVEVAADRAARTREVPVTAALPLRTVRGTLAELAELTPGDAWLRVFVREQPRAGLREEVQDLLPRALEVRIDPELLPAGGGGGQVAARAGRSPSELFAEYLNVRGHDDAPVQALFEELYDEVVSG